MIGGICVYRAEQRGAFGNRCALHQSPETTEHVDKDESGNESVREWDEVEVDIDVCRGELHSLAALEETWGFENSKRGVETEPKEGLVASDTVERKEGEQIDVDVGVREMVHGHFWQRI